MSDAQAQLVENLQLQIEINRKALHDLQEVTRKLELMNRKLQDSEQLKSHFLSNIRNEINNPLSAIMGLSNRLFAGANPSNLPVIARMIYEEAFNLDFQLQNVFAAAELEAGEIAPEWAQVDVCGVVTAILGLLDHAVARKQLSLNVDLPEALIFVSDARKLHLIVINLLANAVEFSPQGQSIEVKAELVREQLHILVRDHGAGIPSADQGAIFDRFRQLQSGTTKDHPGHGLGLSIARALAELLDGSIELQSAPGEGTLFRLVLPMTEERPDTIAPEGNMFFFGETERF
ncbi:MAG: HAMP domain-containing sensor histidine kinase [Desulfuromonadales bacterium]